MRLNDFIIFTDLLTYHAYFVNDKKQNGSSSREILSDDHYDERFHFAPCVSSLPGVVTFWQGKETVSKITC